MAVALFLGRVRDARGMEVTKQGQWREQEDFELLLPLLSAPAPKKELGMVVFARSSRVNS
jgi:hypothetical protein